MQKQKMYPTNHTLAPRYTNSDYIDGPHLCWFRIETDRLEAANQTLKSENAALKIQVNRAKFERLYHTAKRKRKNFKRNQRKIRKGVDPEIMPVAALTASDYQPLSPAALGEAVAVVLRGVTTLESVLELQSHPHLPCLRTHDKFRRLYMLLPGLLELNTMVGLVDVKQEILNLLFYHIQYAHLGEGKSKPRRQHIAILGSPGVGKSKLSHILAKLLQTSGIIPTDKVVEAKRSTLIGKYLGHTATNTQALIDEAEGGVLLIDEVYALGHADGRDSFAKECIDTLTPALDDQRRNFVCIIAGYEKEVQECFFAQNAGLHRRFATTFKIAPYKSRELFQILNAKAQSLGWELTQIKRIQSLIDTHEPIFVYGGGDMETVLKKAQLNAAKRTITTSEMPTAPTLNAEDVQGAILSLNRTVNIDCHTSHLYM